MTAAQRPTGELSMAPEVLERFLAKFSAMDDEQGGCWEWHAALTTSGYGHMSDGSTVRAAHRISYEHFVGAIPEGLEIDHLCSNKACVNPDHLEAVTPQENSRRAGARITHCPKGHAYDETNTVYYQGRIGKVKRCRTCISIYGKVNRETIRARENARRNQARSS